MKLFKINPVRCGWPENLKKASKKKGAFISKRKNWAGRNVGINLSDKERSEANRKARLRESIADTISSLQSEKERRAIRQAINALIGQIPHDNCGWGKNSDGSGVWYKKRNEKGHVKTYKLEL